YETDVLLFPDLFHLPGFAGTFGTSIMLQSGKIFETNRCLSSLGAHLLIRKPNPPRWIPPTFLDHLVNWALIKLKLTWCRLRGKGISHRAKTFISSSGMLCIADFVERKTLCPLLDRRGRY
ncbi:MAG: hypothetical protein ACWGOL_11840, partial [Desulfuromonadales bacterium]